MFCKNCGAAIPDDAAFCMNCGTKTDFVGTDASEKTVLLSDETVLLPENQQQSDSTVLLDESQQDGAAQGNVAVETPNVFGVYRIISEIGHGALGIVYKAVHTRLNKEVVIKQIINPNGGFNRQETDLLKGIKHTYLPQVLDFIEQDGQAFSVMDFIPGADLEKLVAGGKKFRVKEIIKIAEQLCEAVSYLHTRKPPIVHSDIKPANVMLSDNGDICLIDFNVSLALDKNSTAIGGTLGFAPPEQFGIPAEDIKRGIIGGALPIKKVQPVVDERSDVYSIGALLQFLVTGQKPTADYKYTPIPNNIRVPDGLVQIIRKATMLDPSKRYKNAAEMLTAVKNINKLDKRYKALRARRAVATVAAVVLIAGFAVLHREGVRQLAIEHEEKYQGYISEIVSKVESGDYSGAEEIISTAKEFEPTRIEPYYNQEKILHENKEYEKCMEYPASLNIDDLKSNEQNDLGLLAEMYMMSADSAFELENYQNAIELYNKTLSYSELLVDCYRDLTISYARLGDIESAEKSLAAAKELGISNDRLELMQGEIHAAKGEVNDAYDCFVNTLKQTDDDYIKFRALLVCDKTLLADTAHAKENAALMIGLLSAYKDGISIEYSAIVREMLANEYAVAEDYENAANCYQSLLDEGLLNYTLQKNYFNILFTKLQNYDKCLELLENMKSQNSEDYWVYMNFSYTCISQENAKENQLERDYGKAYDYYKQAVEQYAIFSRDGKTDANMDKLKGLIGELISYGWIEEA